MTQHLIQIGNSVGIIIPQVLREEAGLKPGDKVEVKMKGKSLVLSKQKKKVTGDVDEKFMKMLDEFTKTHEDVLEELATR